MAGKSNKTQVFVAILGGIFLIVAAVISSPHWFKYFFPEQYTEQEVVQPKKEKNVITKNEEQDKVKETGTENIVISKIELCPVNSKLLSYFLIEITNEGTKKLKNLSVTIDFGRSSFQEVDILGSKTFIIDTVNTNRIFITYSELKENESTVIYCLLNQPVFKSILINGENLTFSKEYTYKEYIEKGDEKTLSLNGFYIFLQLLIGFILLIFAFFFVTMIYRYFKKKDLINWE